MTRPIRFRRVSFLWERRVTEPLRRRRCEIAGPLLIDLMQVDSDWVARGWWKDLDYIHYTFAQPLSLVARCRYIAAAAAAAAENSGATLLIVAAGATLWWTCDLHAGQLTALTAARFQYICFAPFLLSLSLIHRRA